MPEMSEYKPGTFCWSELRTIDGEGAKKFYSKVFGWTLHDDPVGENAVYTMASIRGKNVGAMFEMDATLKKQGVPPHWLSYISVDDVDETVRQATSLGAATIREPMNAHDIGRMAVVSDPIGAAFALWQPLKAFGAEIVNEPGTLCWYELMTTDEKASGKFYTSLFGWNAAADDGAVNYTMFSRDDSPAGGMIEIQPEWGEIPPNWMTYFAVADCDQTVELVKQSGGHILSEAKDVPEIGRFATCMDPQGAAFAIIALAAGAGG